MIAFHGSKELKEVLLAEIGRHEAADAITKGLYGEAELPLTEFKGCAIGCALHSLNAIHCPIAEAVSVSRQVGDHNRFQTELGIPVELAYHIDTLFENLPDGEAQTWPRRVIEAIPVGANLSGVIPSLLQWMIINPSEGLIAKADPQFHAAYRAFAALVARHWANSGSVSDTEWDAVEDSLAGCKVWARAGAWAGAWARAWAWAGARAGTGAWAGAWAYSRLGEETLRLIRESK